MLTPKQLTDILRKIYSNHHVIMYIDILNDCHYPLFPWTGSAAIGFTINDYRTALRQNKNKIVDICAKIEPTTSFDERTKPLHELNALIKPQYYDISEVSEEQYATILYETTQLAAQISLEIKIKRQINLLNKF